MGVLGGFGTKDILIPSLLNNYNHAVGDFGVVDQRIAYYSPDLHLY